MKAMMVESPAVLSKPMKSTEPNVTNETTGKIPPYPVDNSSNMIADSPPPDPHTVDIVTAVQYGFMDRIVELFQIDSNLATIPVNDNITLLHWAAINNRLEIARYLLDHGAKIDAIGGSLSSTPLHWAVRDGKLEMIVFLLAQGAQADLIDGEGFSTLHLASMFGHTAIVAYLVAKGQDVDQPDKFGVTPLMHAAYRVRNRDPTQLLIRLGARINYQNPTNQYTALHYAVTGNNTEAIRVLIDAGAKTNIQNADNEDPLDMAAKSNSTRHLLFLITNLSYSNNELPRWMQFNRTIRRFGTKLLPYLILILIGFILELDLWFIYKGVLLVVLGLSVRGYTIIFFDDHTQRHLPMAIAQASIFWLYAVYFYFFLKHVHIVSFAFIGLIICTYLSWSNYYWAQKTDPGVIIANREQHFRTIIQLIEQNQFDYETFCTWCLIRRPLRSKHCRECQRCVARFDHHCPWVDNCVGDKNLKFFTGFLFFTPLCLALFLHGAYLYLRNECLISKSNSFSASLAQLPSCAPSVLWFTFIALLHSMWITGLCISVLFQVAIGLTTNERINYWRYKYIESPMNSPFSFGCRQNFVDLFNRRILWYGPTCLDWTRIYSMDDYKESLLTIRRRKQSGSPSGGNSSKLLLNV